jgi:drug/metabolite transporter (DMT)-like permease
MNTKKLLVILAFIAIYFIWGATYLANIFGLKDMKPFVLSTLRYSAAAVILLAWCLVRKLSFPAGPQLKALVISGLLMLCGGAGFVVIGEQYINSGHTAVVIATEPLLFLLMDKKGWRSNFSNKWMLTGLLMGFAGIFLFSRFTKDPNATAGSAMELIKGTVLVLLSTIFWVSGTLYARKHKTGEGSGVADAAVQHLAAAIACGVIGLSLGEWHSFTPSDISPAAWGALAFLVVMGSLVAFIAFSWLMRIKPPALVSTHTYVNPVVAVIIGCLVAKEHISALQVTALVMVLAGVVLTSIKKTAVA